MLWKLLRVAATRDEAIKVLRLARKQARRAASAAQVRSKGKLKRAWRDAAEGQLLHEDSESHLQACPQCQRVYCCWWYDDNDCDDHERLWWHSLDTFLAEFLQFRRLLVPEPASATPNLPDALAVAPAASVAEPASLALEERLFEYTASFGNREHDLRAALAERIHDTHIITRWLNATHPGCDTQRVTKLLCLFSPFWVRSPRDFDPLRGVSLFDHLFSIHRVPACLQAEWLTGLQFSSTHQDLKWLYWSILLGQGASLKRAAVKFGWHVSGRFQKHLEQVPPGLAPLEACILAEVRRLGGTEDEYRRILSNPAYVVDPTESSPEESFWRDAVRWLVAHRDELHDVEADLILTWAMHEHTERQRLGETFSWKGRSVLATLERSREYQRLRTRPWLAFAWAGHGWDWSLDDDRAENWSFVELTSGAELYLEGSALHHCVATYAERCASGDSAIVSLRRNGARCLILEIDPQSNRIVQIRGSCNRAADQDEARAMRRWHRHFFAGQTRG